MVRGIDRSTWGAGALVLLTALTGVSRVAFAEKCPFSASDHDKDENDPPLRCKKCEAIAEELARKNKSVWTLDFKYSRPKRVEVKKETGQPDVFWYVYYEVTNIDKVDHPCFIDVMAESDKGKNRHDYHDTAVAEVTDELRKILGIKEGE